MLVEHRGVAKAVKDLEPLPATAGRLAALLARADWQIREVEEAIALDQALTPRLLTLANSSLMSRGREIGTVAEAVMRLGARAVVQIAMSVGVRRRLAAALPQYGLSEGQLWSHSVAVALAGQQLAARRRSKIPPEAFTAGLMHDIGKLVVARFLDPERIAALAQAQRAGTPLRVAEMEVLGIEHAEIGAAIVEHWALPTRLRLAIQYHHSPEQTDEILASVVHVADWIGHRAEQATSGNQASNASAATASEPDDEPSSAALERIEMKLDDLDTLVVEVGNQLADVLRRYA